MRDCSLWHLIVLFDQRNLTASLAG